MNKTILWLPLAFVLGGMAGYIGPAEKLRALRDKAAEETKAPPPARPAAGVSGLTFRSLIHFEFIFHSLSFFKT